MNIIYLILNEEVKMEKGENLGYAVAVLLGLILVTMFLAVEIPISAANITEQNTTSSAQVAGYIAIGLSTDLATGINFSTVQPNTTTNNATKNYNPDNTTYWVIVSEDGNQNVNISIKDDAPLTSGANTIPNAGYKYDADLDDVSTPTLPGVAITTSYVQAQGGVGPNHNATFRFWLDVPAGQSAGLYNNTVNFQAIPA